MNLSKRTIYNVRFESFIDAPLSARDEIRKFNSLASFEIFNYDYYLVSNFNDVAGKLEYYLLIPLETKKIKRVAEKIVEEWNSDVVEFDGLKILIVKLEDDNKLLELMKRVREVVKTYTSINEDKTIKLKIAGNDLIVDSEGGSIVVDIKKIDDPVVAKVLEFVLLYDYFNMAKILFRIEDFIIVSLDGLTIITRFKTISRADDYPEKSLLLRVIIPKVKDLKTQVIEHRVRVYIDDIKNMNEELFESLKNKVIKYAELNNLDKEKLLDALYGDKLNVIASYESEGSKFMTSLIYFDGQYSTEGLIPEHIIKHILNTYYAKLSRNYSKLLRDYSHLFKKAEPAVAPEPSTNETIKEVVASDEKPQEKKKSFFSVLFDRGEKDEKKEVKKKPQKKKRKKKVTAPEEPVLVSDESEDAKNYDVVTPTETLEEVLEDDEVTIELI